MLHMLGISAAAGIGLQRRHQPDPVIGQTRSPGFPRQGGLNAAQRVDIRNRPVRGKADLGPRRHQRRPDIGIGPPRPPEPGQRRFGGKIHRTGHMRRLHRGYDPHGTKARNIGGIDQFNMFNPVAAVAPPVGRHGGSIAIQHPAHRAIADGMHRDLQAAPIRLNGNLGKALGPEQSLTTPTRLVGIIAQHQGGAAFHHPVHEQLDHAAGQPVALPARRHGRGDIQRRQPHMVPEMKRHLHAGRQFALGLDLRQQVQRI